MTSVTLQQGISTVTSIGLIGIENSHVDHFIRFLNTEERFPGYRATTLVGGEPERRDKLAADGNIDQFVENPADLIGKVDAAIISTRDGSKHAEQAIPLLEAGIPVLVDKPLAASVADAEAMVAAAKKGNTIILSASALRAVDEVAELKKAKETVGEIQAVHVAGPADPNSEYAGLSFYGIHEIEAALELTNEGDFESVDVRRSANGVQAATKLGDILTTIHFITKDEQGQIGFFATVVGSHGLVHSQLNLTKDYNFPLLDLFVKSIEQGSSVFSEEKMLRAVRLLQAITDQL